MHIVYFNVARKVSKAIGIIYKSSFSLRLRDTLLYPYMYLSIFILLREGLGIILPVKPQKINHTAKTGCKNNVENCFRCSHWTFI